MARPKKEKRNVHGVILLDKPAGMSSNEALQAVKRLYSARKAGHTGSLDPLATGLLPLCMGEATKISAYLLEANKHYRTVCKLGQRTSTGDAEGEVVQERPVGEYSTQDIEAVLARFRGDIEQIPPMYSALKHQGRRLYELARNGVEVERQPRAVTIHSLRLLRHEGVELELDIECTKGTYVRTLIEDIGEALGCGAHVSALRRVGVEPYDHPAMVSLDELTRLAQEGRETLDSALMPIDTALGHWPRVDLDADSAYYVKTGQAVLVPGAPTMGLVRLYDQRGCFMGVGQILDDGRVAPKRLILQA